jgi:hypothetical protein
LNKIPLLKQEKVIPMNILQAFSSGFRRALSEWKMMILLYAVNLLAALPLALAFQATLSSGLGMSMDSAHLMEGLDFSVMRDFLNLHGDGVGALLQQILWLLLVYMILNTFLAGGILTVVRGKKGNFSASAFFGGCGMYFLRFLRLFLIFGVLLIVILAILGGVLGAITSVIIDSATSEITDVWARVSMVVLLMLPLMLVIMIADYAKIIVVAQDEHSMIKTAWWSTRLVFRNLFRTFGLEVLMMLIPVGLFALYVALDLSIGMSSGVTILVMFVIQQLFIMSKAWTKVFFFSGELSLYHSLQPFGGQLSVPRSDIQTV